MNKALLLAAALLPAGFISSQTSSRIIRGTVSDAVSLAPLEGVTIVAASSRVYSESQTDGIFTIPVTEKDSVLLFTSEAYGTTEVSVSGGGDINVRLDKHKQPAAASPSLATILPGRWRGAFTIREGVEVPFNFSISPNGKNLSVSLLNGDEKFATGDAVISGDSVFIPLALFDNELALKYNGTGLSGVFRRQDLRGNPVPVQAIKGVNYRFIETGSTPVKDISGKYDVVFRSANGKEEKAVGVFRQQGNKLQATFLRVTGDSRYLDGIIEDNHIQLSSFIGSGPSFYKATVNPDGTLQGEIVSARGGTPFTATPNASAALPDAYTLTALKEGTKTFQFRFSDAEGNWLSEADSRFKGKPLIVAIGGTWCPNCMDEAAFLAPWYAKNKSRGIEVIGLQYERDTASAFVKKTFDRFKKRYGIQYPLVLGGVADKQEVVRSLPSLQNFVSFPTMLFIDRNGTVQKIHTGFSGPATGKAYEDFIHEFNEAADRLIAAK